MKIGLASMEIECLCLGLPYDIFVIIVLTVFKVYFFT